MGCGCGGSGGSTPHSLEKIRGLDIEPKATNTDLKVEHPAVDHVCRGHVTPPPLFIAESSMIRY